jgi:hypothetical protein
MMSRKLKNVLSTSRDPYGPAPQQMTLFPEEKPGRTLEQMKIKTLLKAFYKTADNNATVEQAG